MKLFRAETRIYRTVDHSNHMMILFIEDEKDDA